MDRWETIRCCPQDTALPEGNRSGGLRQRGLRLGVAAGRKPRCGTLPLGVTECPLAKSEKLRGFGGWPPSELPSGGDFAHERNECPPAPLEGRGGEAP